VETVFVTPDGRTLTAQQVLAEFIGKTEVQEALGSLQAGTGKSVLQSLFDGSPINVTNFITERPLGFPVAPIDSAFQQRAQAIGPSLRVDNPGASSVAGLPNFSRLAALGVDLSQVDLFGVNKSRTNPAANPGAFGVIKTGSGPLTPSQRAFVDAARLAIDPRNQTSAVKKEISDNIAKAQAANLERQTRTAQLTTAGFNETDAKAFLRAQGFNVTGSLTAASFAAIEQSLRKRPPVRPTPAPVILPPERPLSLAGFTGPDLTPEERAEESRAVLLRRGGFQRR
jgi:hypothetical protein